MKLILDKKIGTSALMSGQLFINTNFNVELLFGLMFNKNVNTPGSFERSVIKV